jgi:serine/threonine protein kinase
LKNSVGNSLWIVMEHCAGGSVGDAISASGGAGLPEPVIAHVCAEALKVCGVWFGLSYFAALVFCACV